MSRLVRKSLTPLILGSALCLSPTPGNAQIALTYEPPDFSAFPLGTVVPVTLDFCSLSGWLSWQVTTIYFNNVDVTAEFAYQGWSSPNCQAFGGIDGYVYAGQFTVVPGPNDLRLVWSTSEGSGEYTIHYYATYAVKVTPDFATAVRTPNTSGHVETFAVQNLGASSTTFVIGCATSGTVTCTKTSARTLTLASNASSNVTATYSVGAPGVGTLRLLASVADVSDSGMFTITIVAPPIVTPDAEARLIAQVTGAGVPFTVTNPNPVGRGYTFATACTPIVTACSPPGNASIGPGETRDVFATLTTSGSTFATGTLTLTATDQVATTQQDVGSYTFQIAPAGPVVTRDLCLTIAAGPGAAFECGDLRLTHVLPPVRSLNKTRAPTLIYNSQHAHPFPIVSADVSMPAGSPLPTTVLATLTVNGVGYQRSWPGSAWGSAGQSRRVPVGFDALAAGLTTGVHPYTLLVRRITSPDTSTVANLSGHLTVVNRSTSPLGPGWWLAGYERLHFTGMPANQVLWVGGDGSAVVYQRAGAIGNDSIYIGVLVDRPDSLRRVAGSPVEWKRLLPGGDTVVFSDSGAHIRTASRLGHKTVFIDTMIAGTRAPKSIQVPPHDSLRYHFTYAGSPARITQVAAPDSQPGTQRLTSFTWTGDSVRIVDPGAPAPVTFRYQAGGTNRMLHRADRRGAITQFAYDSGFRLMSSKLALGGLDSIYLSFCAADVRGWAACSPTLVVPDSAWTIFNGPRDSTPSDTSGVDVMQFQVDRFGQPIRIRDPYQFVTTLSGTDPTGPARITRIGYPNGRIIGMTYDARGNLATSTDSNRYVAGQHATSRYQWDQRWDRVTQTKAPTGEIMKFGYDTNTGNRTWQEDGRGATSRVNFTYYTTPAYVAGLVQLVMNPAVAGDSVGAMDSLGYDSLGNLAIAQSPKGYTTTTVSDRIGRPTVVESPVSSARKRETMQYDQRGLVTEAISFGPIVSGVDSQKVVVRSIYDPEGHLEALMRISVPDPESIDTITTRWRYDLAGRRVAEIAPDGAVDSTRYDPAANAIAAVSRRGHTMRMEYDRLNRLWRRITDSVWYYGRLQGIEMRFTTNAFDRPYPWYPSTEYVDNGCWQDPNCFSDSTAWRLLVPGDTALFSYNEMGNLLTADNFAARIQRSYFKDGQVKTDTLRTRTWYATDFNQHIYGIAYRYDLSGRLTALAHPWALAPRVSGVVKDTARYEYDAVTGFLSAVVDPIGNRFEFTYNARGERIRGLLPGGIRDTLAFNADGQLIQEQILNGSTSAFRHPDDVLRHHVLQYADAFRVANANNLAGWGDTTVVAYSGLGHVVRNQYTAPAKNYWLTARATSIERVTLDAIGNGRESFDTNNLKSNVVTKFAQSRHYHAFAPRTGRLHATQHLNPTAAANRNDSTLFDAAGNIVFSYQVASGGSAQLEDHAYFYDAAGKLRVSEYRTATKTGSLDWPFRMVFEEYRYDALGRRVVLRMQRTCTLPAGNHTYPCNWGTLRRTIWDGSAELYEIQTYGSRTGAGEGVVWDQPTMENDTLPLLVWDNNPHFYDASPNFGRVAYTHGPGLDQPVSAIRIHYVDTLVGKPRINWAPITVAPHWNWRGQADYGTMADGGWKTCTQPPPNDTRCATPPWRIRGFMFTQQMADTARPQWWGSLINLKEDGTGTQYRRNRYLDPATGRFTQEDPIGMAGGLNLYGFANGDPVTFSDPFGLCPPEDENYSDCAPGTSEWYANRIASGQGSRLVNEVGGALATCAESVSCMTSLIPGSVIGAAAGRVAQALGIAGKATGNVSVAVGTQLEAQIAGKLWTGAGSSPILATRGAGEIVGLKSADGLRIFRQAVEKGAGHFSAGQVVANLVNKATGGNTHLVIKAFMWW